MTKQKIYNSSVLIISALAGIYFLLPSSGFPIEFAIGSFGITLMYAINYFKKISITLIFVIMIGYMLAGLLNWPLKEGKRVSGFAELFPALLPFIAFIILALLYWENRNKF